MRRTQLYLDEDLWQALHTRARKEGTTISDLVRRAARERYQTNLEERRKAMQALVGIRHGRPEFRNSAAYIRKLRRGRRLERLNQG